MQPLGAAQRHTAPFPPRPHPLARAGGAVADGWGDGDVARCLEPSELLVHLESSGAKINAPTLQSPSPGVGNLARTGGAGNSFHIICPHVRLGTATALDTGDYSLSM